jgi:quinol monooxygenase YgiN
MILLRIIMNVHPEKQKEVMQTLLSLIELSGHENRYPCHDISIDIEDQNAFTLISEWETRQDLDRHISSNEFSVLLGTKSLLREPLGIKIFTVSDVEGIEVVNYIRKKRK